MPSVDEACMGTRVHRVKVYDDCDEDMNVERCDCGTWACLNENGECDQCAVELETNEQIDTSDQGAMSDVDTRSPAQG